MQHRVDIYESVSSGPPELIMTVVRTFQSLRVVPFSDIGYAYDVDLATIFLFEGVDFLGTSGTATKCSLAMSACTRGGRRKHTL